MSRVQGDIIEKKFAEKFIELLESMESDSGIQELDFRGFCFPQMDFSNCTFLKTVNFSCSPFQSKANFGGSTFEAKAYFRGSTFNAEANFEYSTFKAEADFQWSTFKAKANFWTSGFMAGANFLNSTFEAEADFPDSTFTANANFSGSTFKAEANFWDSTFNAEAEFQMSTFKSKANFEGSIFLGICNFRALRLERDAQITFEKVNLKKASFLDTNLEGINFRDVDWYRPDSRLNLFRRKHVLWDEAQGHDYEKIAENYRQLVLSYERKRDFETAESFHIGEMEMRRKKKGWLNVYSLYRILSNYGTSYWQGFIVLVLMLLFFSEIFLLTGFKPSKETLGIEQRLIEYNIWPDSKNQLVSVRQWLTDYGKAILFTLSIVTFQRERFYQPVGVWSQFWLFISVFVLTSQAALVLLAIRRQFRR